jgi:hypothetical protein
MEYLSYAPKAVISFPKAANQAILGKKFPEISRKWLLQIRSHSSCTIPS